MRRSEAFDLVLTHAAQFDIRCGDNRVLETRRTLESLFLCHDRFRITVDTDYGTVKACVSRRLHRVTKFEHQSANVNCPMIPLWAYLPCSPSFSGIWREDGYKYRWHHWYRGLTDVERERYKQKFPAPLDKALCWAGFYEEIADVPAKADSITDFIIGRV